MDKLIKPSVILCDLDGTIALNPGRRGPFEFKRVKEDDLNVPVAEVVHNLNKLGYHVVFLSARDDSCAIDTAEWLYERAGFLVEFNKDLFMRKTGDRRKDCIVKEEIYRQNIEPFYDVFLVFDDRNQVVNMWRRIGLTCFQVAQGDF